MLHFLTGFYYFTWFENLLIIIAGLSLGHFLSLIVCQVQLIRHHRPLKRTLIEMAPWFVILLVLMLSPVFASGIAVGWMVIIGLLECIIEYLITLKLKQSRPAKSHARQKTRHHKPAVEEFDDSDFSDVDNTDQVDSQYDDSEFNDVDNTDQVDSQYDDNDIAEDDNTMSERPVSQTVSHVMQTPQHDQSSTKSVSHTDNQAAPAAESDSEQTSRTAQSAPESQAEQAPAALANAESSVPTASHQPTSQEMMDHMFDFDPNVDYKAEAKSDAVIANNEQSAAQTQVASSVPAASEQPSSQEAMDHVFDFDPNVDYEAEAKSAQSAKQSEADNDKDNN